MADDEKEARARRTFMGDRHSAVISPSWLAAPGTNEALVASSEGVVAGGQSFPFKVAAGNRYVDFTAGGTLTAMARGQQRLYDSSESQYHRQMREKPSFMAEFVAMYVSGRVKNKDVV